MGMVADLGGKSIWEVYKFPTLDMNHCIHTIGPRWVGYRKTMTKPFCWTPTEPFSFDGKRFIALYPCAAWETRNFGWIAQKTWNGITLARA